MSAPTMPLNYIGVSELLTLAKMLLGFEIKNRHLCKEVMRN